LDRGRGKGDPEPGRQLLASNGQPAFSKFAADRLPGIGIERLRDPPTEWSRQFEALGLNPE